MKTSRQSLDVNFVFRSTLIERVLQAVEKKVFSKYEDASIVNSQPDSSEESDFDENEFYDVDNASQLGDDSEEEEVDGSQRSETHGSASSSQSSRFSLTDYSTSSSQQSSTKSENFLLHGKEEAFKLLKKKEEKWTKIFDDYHTQVNIFQSVNPLKNLNKYFDFRLLRL